MPSVVSETSRNPGADTLVGYARVSTRGQDHQSQLDALAGAHCREVAVETASTRGEQPKLRAVLDRLQPGDTLVIYKPDRVARSMKELLVFVDAPTALGAALRGGRNDRVEEGDSQTEHAAVEESHLPDGAGRQGQGERKRRNEGGSDVSPWSHARSDAVEVGDSYAAAVAVESLDRVACAVDAPCTALLVSCLLVDQVAVLGDGLAVNAEQTRGSPEGSIPLPVAGYRAGAGRAMRGGSSAAFFMSGPGHARAFSHGTTKHATGTT
uniref:recombinase family protein n=1 Tax=Microtetraspora malaysiensis TaxID=161358 RepID=UPI003F492294